jgi:hypothetical protein
MNMPRLQKFIGDTECILHIRYKEHIHIIKINKDFGYLTHTKNIHQYWKIEDVMKRPTHEYKRTF